MLMVAVAIVLGVTFKQRMEEYFLKSPNSFIAKSLRNYTALFSQSDGSGRPYKRFTVIQVRRNR